VGLKAGLNVLERENRLTVPEFEPQIVHPRPNLSIEYAVAVSLVPLKIQKYEF